MTKKSSLVEARLSKRADGIKKWIDANGDNCQEKQSHLADGIERVYWHYGYMVALMDILRLLKKSKIQEN